MNMDSSSKKKATTFIGGEVSCGKHEVGWYIFKNDGILDKIVMILRRQSFERKMSYS